MENLLALQSGLVYFEVKAIHYKATIYIEQIDTGIDEKPSYSLPTTIKVLNTLFAASHDGRPEND